MENGIEGSSGEDRVTVSASDSLRLWLEVPDRVQIGEPVPIRLGVENASDRELELHLRGRDIVFDLVVSDLGGETVWRRLHDSAIPAILRLEPLPPEGVLEFSDTWNQLTNEGETVPPGTYIVEGELLTDEDPLGTPLHRLRIGEGPQR